MSDPQPRQIVVRLTPQLRPMDSRGGMDLDGLPVQTIAGGDSAALTVPPEWTDLDIARWVRQRQAAGTLAAVGPEGQPAGYRLAYPAAWVPWGRRPARPDLATVSPATKSPPSEAIGPPIIQPYAPDAMLRDHALHGITPAVQARGRYGAGVLVVVLDTYCYTEHPEFGGQFVHWGGWPADNEQHGTHVAGIVHAIAPEADLMTWNCLPGGRGSEDGIQRGYVEATDWARAHGYAAVVVSCSFGADSLISARIGDGVRYAQQAGAVVIAAAGNRRGASIGSPANEADWRVVALQTDGRTPSSYATLLDGHARRAGTVGDDVYSTLPGGLFGRMSGSSMACPVLSGMAALWWAAQLEAA